MIRNLTPRPAEKGKIKIGGLGEERKKRDGTGTYMLPVKFDSFKIVTTQRDAAGRFIEDKELMERLMQAQGVQKLLAIPIRLLFDDPDLNFFTRYAAYSGKSIWCSGDGVEAQRVEKDGKFSPIECPCEHLESGYAGQPKCKPWGNMRCLVEGVDRVGGIWSFKTTSWNSVNAILSSMALIRTITGGPLAGIPLMMVLSPKTVSTPDGKTMVAYIVSLEYRGPEEKLAELGYEIAKRRIEHRIRMDTVEVEARKLLVAPHEETLEDQEATAAEFYPDPAEVEEGKKPASPKPAGSKKKTAATQSPAQDPEHEAAAGTQGQDPGNGGGPEPLEATVKENLTVQPAITLPALMELAKKPDGMVDLPIGLVTTKGVPIGQWLDWGPNLGGDMQVVLELVDNLREVAQGLTVAVIQKAFNEAGIILKVVTAADAQQEGKERIEDPLPAFTPPQGGRSTAAAPRGNGGHGEQRKSLF